MRRRLLVKPDIEVTELALGAWAIGGKGYGPVEPAEAEGVVEAYLDGGGNGIDTARGYQHSEEAIGNVLRRRGCREKVVLSSKTAGGSKLENIPQMRSDLETSLRLLGTDYLDVYHLHLPPQDAPTRDAALAEMAAFKAEGKIRAVAASVRGGQVDASTDLQCREYVDTGMVDVLQVIYSIFRTGNAAAMDYAAEHGVGIIARTVLESGFLTGKYRNAEGFSATDHRHRWTEAQIARFHKEADYLKFQYVEPPFDSVAQIAIKFALSASAVSTVILGARTADQVRRNLATETLPGLDPDAVEALFERYRAFNDFANLQG